MVLFNKASGVQRMIVTVSEYGISEEDTLVLKVENKSSNINYELTLPSNSSAYPSRYDEYYINTEEINEWAIGQYIYSIMLNDTVLEIGLLEVIGDEDDPYLSIEEDETADDYIVYDSEAEMPI